LKDGTGGDKPPAGFGRPAGGYNFLRQKISRLFLIAFLNPARPYQLFQLNFKRA
jgi:hypothetical protein